MKMAIHLVDLFFFILSHFLNYFKAIQYGNQLLVHFVQIHVLTNMDPQLYFK